MRLALPITSHDDMRPLAAAGANEFYCGFMDESWSKVWGNHDSMTRRQGNANVAKRAELEAIAALGKQMNTPVWLAVNGSYTGEQLPQIRRLCEQWRELGGSGVILRDLQLLSSLRGMGLRLCASLLTVCLNHDTLAVLHGNGADRVVLPRWLTIAEMAAMHKAVPECELETMVMGDPCPMTDGFCRSVHNVGYSARGDGQPAQKQIFTCNVSGKADHLCSQLFGAQTAPGCAACKLAALNVAGISVGKFGGRGTSLSSRLERLKFMQIARDAHPGIDLPKEHAARFGRCLCYFPDVDPSPAIKGLCCAPMPPFSDGSIDGGEERR